MSHPVPLEGIPAHAMDAAVAAVNEELKNRPPDAVPVTMTDPGSPAFDPSAIAPMAFSHMPEQPMPPVAFQPQEGPALSNFQMLDAAIQPMTQWGFVRDPKDDNLIATFRKADDGSDIDWLQIQTPGDETNVILRIPDMEDKLRFHRQYQMYKQDTDQYPDHHQFNQVTFIDRGTQEYLQRQGIRTLEQLASVADGTIDMLGIGMRALQQKAKDFLEERKKVAAYDALAARMNETQSKQLEIMEKMQARIDQLEAALNEKKK